MANTARGLVRELVAVGALRSVGPETLSAVSDVFKAANLYQAACEYYAAASWQYSLPPGRWARREARALARLTRWEIRTIRAWCRVPDTDPSFMPWVHRDPRGACAKLGRETESEGRAVPLCKTSAVHSGAMAQDPKTAAEFALRLYRVGALVPAVSGAESWDDVVRLWRAGNRSRRWADFGASPTYPPGATDSEREAIEVRADRLRDKADAECVEAWERLKVSGFVQPGWEVRLGGRLVTIESDTSFSRVYVTK